ncbi:MAG: OmpA family protein [Bacteroidaceae bacterium]|nr:OmpA family protein [Bacteroidaceae bacterium]
MRTRILHTLHIAAGLTLMMSILFSCGNPNIYHKKGDQALAIGEYYTASIHYKKAYSRTPSKDKEKRGQRAFLMGECYRHIGYAQKAVAAYQNAVRYKYPDSICILHLARQQLKCSMYKQAAVNFQEYLKLDPTNILARNGLRSTELAPEWKANPNQYSIRKENIFNSRRSDYSPMLVGDDSDILVFTSTRSDATGDDISGVTGVKFSDLFQSRKNEEGKWQQPEGIEGSVNTEYEEGASCISPNGRVMYFTRCSSDPDYPRYAEIWQSNRSDATWGSPSKCEISKDTLTSYAHPAVSPDGRWLYYVSDALGGEGGLDIWRTMILDNGFGGSEPLGPPINTPGDEMFPSFRPNGDLYFSSDGHPGMGGLDIFIAHPKYEVRDEIAYGDTSNVTSNLLSWEIENQQFPLNSAGDDFGMTFEGVHNRGFYCTSRNDGKGWEHIYSFECPEILQTVTGWVYEKDGYELPEALVYMVGNDGTNERLSVRGDGSFTQVVKPGVDYVFLGTCKGYLNVMNALRLEPTEESIDTALQFPLPPINVPVLIDNIFYEFDKADLTPESTAALDQLVAMMNQNPNITIELSAHCDYRGNDAYNERLSQRRAESVVNYMIAHGIKTERMTPKGYGESRPKVVTKKMTEKYPWLAEGDTLTEAFILKNEDIDKQEEMNALNRRTEFKVLRTTYGTTLKEYDPSAVKPREEKKEDEDNFIF